MDIETLLRRLHLEGTHHNIRTAIDAEGRVRLYLTEGDTRHEYIMVGDRFIEPTEPPAKPPTQTFTPVGVDSFRGMESQ
jgi:hypothetical protein